MMMATILSKAVSAASDRLTTAIHDFRLKTSARQPALFRLRVNPARNIESCAGDGEKFKQLKIEMQEWILSLEYKRTQIDCWNKDLEEATFELKQAITCFLSAKTGYNPPFQIVNDSNCITALRLLADPKNSKFEQPNEFDHFISDGLQTLLSSALEFATTAFPLGKPDRTDPANLGQWIPRLRYPSKPAFPKGKDLEIEYRYLDLITYSHDDDLGRELISSVLVLRAAETVLVEKRKQLQLLKADPDYEQVGLTKCLLNSSEKGVNSYLEHGHSRLIEYACQSSTCMSAEAELVNARSSLYQILFRCAESVKLMRGTPLTLFCRVRMINCLAADICLRRCQRLTLASETGSFREQAFVLYKVVMRARKILEKTYLSPESAAKILRSGENV